MLRKTMFLMFTLFMLVTNSTPLLAENNLNSLLPKTSKPVTVKPYSTPASALQQAIQQSGLYDHLSNHPDFLKIQAMAYRVWEKQTGKKTRVFYSRRKAFSRRIE